MKESNYNSFYEVPDGTKFYLLDGEIHRVDGPATIYPDGEVNYALCGEILTKEDWFKRLTIEEKKKVIYEGIL